MRGNLTLSFIILILQSIATAQDWQCVHDSSTALFKDEFNTIRVVKISSSAEINGYRHFYPDPVFRDVSVSPSSGQLIYCADTNGVSWLGSFTSAGIAGNFFTNISGDAIRFRTDAQPGEPWICCRISDTTRLWAKITGCEIDTVLGIPDSVRSISFQATLLSGDSVIHPLNSQTFRVSKHFGMITFCDFYYFPECNLDYSLAGYQEQELNLGEHNLTNHEVFDFSVGDEFHTYEGGEFSQPVFYPSKRTVSRVLGLTWNAQHDTVTYLMSMYQDHWYGMMSYEHHYSKLTYSVSYPYQDLSCKSLDFNPGQSLVCPGQGSSVQSVNTYVQYRSPDGKYGNRRIKKRENEYGSGSYCSDSLFQKIMSNFQPCFLDTFYVEGCGGLYWNQECYDYIDHTSSHFYKDLVYYRKGNETWGTPFDTTGWQVPNNDANIFPSNGKYTIFPNPANHEITIQIQREGRQDISLKVVDMYDRIVRQLELHNDKTVLDVSEFGSGMYILKYYTGDQLIATNKFIRN